MLDKSNLSWRIDPVYPDGHVWNIVSRVKVRGMRVLGYVQRISGGNVHAYSWASAEYGQNPATGEFCTLREAADWVEAQLKAAGVEGVR